MHDAQDGHWQGSECETRQEGRGKPSPGGQPIDQRSREYTARPQRSEQVAVAASFGAEPLVADKHQGDRLRPVHERDAEEEPGQDSCSGRSHHRPHSLEEVRGEGARFPARVAGFPAPVQPLQAEREQERGRQERQGVDGEREHGGRHREQRSAHCGPHDDRQVVHQRVERVRGREVFLADERGRHCHHRGHVGGTDGRCGEGEEGHGEHGPVGSGDRCEGAHRDGLQQV